MTTKTISGTTINGGYTLSLSYNTLSITKTGEINGGSYGVFCSNISTIINHGSIVNSSVDGIYLTSGGSVTNGSASANTATIESSGVGIYIKSGSAAVTNFGTISGATYSVYIPFRVGPAATLTVESGSDLIGLAKGGGGAKHQGGTLELAAAYGTITNLGATGAAYGTMSGYATGNFSGFGSYVVDKGSAWTLAGTDSVNENLSITDTITDDGILLSSGSLTVKGSITGYGTLEVIGGTATIANGAAVTVTNLAINGGAATITNGATVTATNLALNGGTTNLYGSLTSSGAFYESRLAILYLGSKEQLSLGTFAAYGLIDGEGTVTVNQGTIGDGAIGGTAVLIDTGAVTDRGGLFIGGGSSGSASLVIGSGATWTTTGNVDLLHGSAASYIEVEGTLIGDVADHFSIEDPITDTGLILAQSGTMFLKGAVTSGTGTGDLQIDSGATLEVDSSVASGLTANLEIGTATDASTLTLGGNAAFGGAINCIGAYDTIDLAKSATFVGTITNFGTNDTIDLLGVDATSASINANYQLVVVYRTGTPVVTLQLSSKNAGETFGVVSNKVGTYWNSTITISAGTPPSLLTETISTSHSGGIKLSSTYNMLSITGSGTVNGNGGAYGVLSSFGATIINNGSICNNSQFGVELESSGYVINGSTTNTAAYIQSSGYGAYTKHASVTVTNFGTIAGGTSGAVKFGSKSDRLIVEGGSKFVGAVQGGGGTLELATGTGAITNLGATGTISGAEAMTFSGFGSYQLDPGSSWTLSGTTSLGSTASLTSAGTLTLAGTIGTMGTTAANLSLTGGTTYLDQSLTITGAFSEDAAATLTLESGHALSIADATTLEGLIDGDGSVTMAAGGSVDSLAISNGATLIVAGGAVTENASVGVGAGTLGNASIVIDSGATWTINGAIDIRRGSPTAGIEVEGSFVGSCTTGVSGPSWIFCPITVTSTGTIDAYLGTLGLVGTVSGSGTLEIQSGATLVVDSSVASSVTANLETGTATEASTLTLGANATFGGAITCLGAYDTIDLPKSATITGAIAGFQTNDTIDLLKTNATSASINAYDQLVVMNGTTTVATLQLTGTYSSPTFTFGSDGSGGTDVTLATPGAKPPPGAPSPAQSVLALNSAMAGLEPGAGSTVAALAHDEAWRPTLLGPKPQLA